MGIGPGERQYPAEMPGGKGDGCREEGKYKKYCREIQKIFYEKMVEHKLKS